VCYRSATPTLSSNERAYARTSLGAYEAALADVNEQALLRPDEPTVYEERATTQHFLGNLRGAFEDRNRAVELLPSSASALLWRAKARLWMAQLEKV
jgi:tetratricopeptide (TPR) repeat protein